MEKTACRDRPWQTHKLSGWSERKYTWKILLGWEGHIDNLEGVYRRDRKETWLGGRSCKPQRVRRTYPGVRDEKGHVDNARQ